MQANVDCAKPVVAAVPCQGSAMRQRANGHEIHEGDHGGGCVGVEDESGGEGDDGDASLPPRGPLGPLDPPPPIHSLLGLVCPLSPSPLAHCVR